MTYPVCKYMFL